MPKLTPTQQRVMDWMSKGWPANITSGHAVAINGKRVCTFSTIRVLERMGLVEQIERWTYAATPAGRGEAPATTNIDTR